MMRLMRLLRREGLLAMTWSIVLLFVLPLCGIAQEGGMVDWKFSAKKVAVDTFEVTAKAVIAEGWHIYAQDSGEGSMPTKFMFTLNPLVKLEGKVLEQGVLKKSRNEVMESELRYYTDSVMFVQKVQLKAGVLKQVQDDTETSSAQAVLRGTVEFMVCNQDMCLPPEEIEFKIPLK